MFSIINIAQAQSNEAPCPTGYTCLVNPIQATSVPKLVGNVIQGGVGIVGSIALLVFIWGGFLWMTSAGDPKRVDAGKNAMKWAVIGLFIIFASYALVNTIFTTVSSGK